MFYYSKNCSQLLNGNNNAHLAESLWKLNETITTFGDENAGRSVSLPEPTYLWLKEVHCKTGNVLYRPRTIGVGPENCKYRLVYPNIQNPLALIVGNPGLVNSSLILSSSKWNIVKKNSHQVCANSTEFWISAKLWKPSSVPRVPNKLSRNVFAWHSRSSITFPQSTGALPSPWFSRR